MKAAEIQQLLPGVFQRTVRPGNPLCAFLDVMELMHARAEEAIADIDQVFDARRAPEDFVPLLARWVDLDRLLKKRLQGKDATLDRVMPSGLGRLRELVAEAAYLSKWRGTRKGLLLFLQVATGQTEFKIDEQVPDEDGRPRPFHIRIRGPISARVYEDLICEIIESEKPAYVTYELEFAGPPTPMELTDATVV